ncbi:MAG: HD domain-containing protein [Halobacteriota archaeon]
MAAIKDSVHDHIEVGDVAEALLDTPEMQRLRNISQLGTVQLVYPSANHTRFEHSLGVFHLASRALEHLGIEGRQADHVRAAALLHDVGHAPFSHNVEDLIHHHTGKYHDDVGELVADGAVGDVLRSHDLDPGRVAGLVAGRGQYGQLVSGELDVDRMDYLVRDAHHTGVPYGTIDHERLLRSLTFVDGALVLEAGNVQAAESLLLARALMNPTVYQHHVARIGKAMLRRSTEHLLDAPDITAEQTRRMDDHDLRVALRQTPAAADLVRRLDERDLYKRAVWAELSDVPADLLSAPWETHSDLEAEVAESAGVDEDEVIVDVPPEPSMTETSSRVVVSGEVRRLDRQSPLVSALRTSQRNQWRLGVYAPEDATEAVGKVAVGVLGLDIDGGLVSDVGHTLHATLDEFR